MIEDLAEVEVAASGEEALRHLLKGEFAVILLDVYMPGMDGYETARIIREREQTKRIPIVFLSAVNKEKEHLMRGYAMGAVDYVFKPVEPVVLRSKVAVFVDLFTMTREIQRKAAQEQRLLDANLRANAERLRIEQALRVAEQRQAAIIQSLPIILYLEGDRLHPRVPQFVGGDFAAVTGFTFAAVEADPGLWADRLHPDDKERTLKALEDRDRTGAMAIEYRWRCADGRYKHFLDQAVLLPAADGGPARYAGTLLDVTDRKMLEKELLQARKMDAIGQLTGGIAHDFNNLLAAVLGGLDLIERRVPLDEEQRKILAMTRHAAEQGSELVRRLLAFARRQQLAPSAIDIGRLSTTVTDLLAHTLGGLVQLEWRSQARIWRAYADSAQLELALMNLIINARDAMPQGGAIKVTGRNAKREADNRLGLPAGDYVVLGVADSGAGIPADILEQVTEPFFTTKEVGKGTGPRPLHGLRLRAPVGRRDRHTLRGRSRHDRRNLAAARGRARASRRRAAAAGAARQGRDAPAAHPAGRRSRRGARDHGRHALRHGPRRRSRRQRPRYARKARSRARRLRPHRHRLCDAAHVRQRHAGPGQEDPRRFARHHHQRLCRQPHAGPEAPRDRLPHQAVHAGSDEGGDRGGVWRRGAGAEGGIKSLLKRDLSLVLVSHPKGALQQGCTPKLSPK